MISTANKAHTTQKLLQKQPHVPVTKKLEARWENVDGKLVCRWVQV